MTQRKEYFTVVQVAKMMNVTRAAVYKKIKNGEIKAEKIYGRILIPAKTAEVLGSGRLTKKVEKEIDRGVARVVKEYGETLKKLGKE
jgi:excisionase family DNA binding protein